MKAARTREGRSRRSTRVRVARSARTCPTRLGTLKTRRRDGAAMGAPPPDAEDELTVLQCQWAYL
jgi:hypothetical protein